MKSWRYENWCTCGAYLTRKPNDLSWRDARGDNRITLMGQSHKHLPKYSAGDEAIPEETLGTEVPPVPVPIQGPKPKHPREYGATRFYARVVAFDCECPRCGRIAQVRPSTPAGYIPTTARWTCPHRSCAHTYVIGLLAWPLPRGAGRKGTPDDQVPGPRQLAQLRAQGAGHWLPDSLREEAGRMDMSNLTGEEDRPEPEDPLDLDTTINPQEDTHGRHRKPRRSTRPGARTRT